MDSTTLTHVAAILVGVLLTYLFVGGSKKSNEEPATVAATSTTSKSREAPAASADTETSSSSKKKKKKKNKKNNNTATENEAPAAKQAVPEKSTDDDDDDSDDDEEEKTPAAPVAAPEGGGGKKKKKKKGKGAAGAGNNTQASNSNNASANQNKENQPKVQQQAQQQQQQRQQPPPQPQEDEWIVAAPSKKNKGKKGPNTPKEPAANEKASSTPVQQTDSVTVDAKKIGIIIGPKGATLKGLEEATGCKLDVNAPSKDEQPTAGQKASNKPQMATVVLTGDKEATAKAKKAIQELASKGYATILQSENFGEYSISVHPRFLAEIVGPSGNTIKALQSTLDVKITIPSTDWKPNSIQVGQVKMARVGIAGSKDNAQKCKEAIQALMKYHHHEITHPGMIHEEVYVPSEFFHCVIGPRGSEIKHIKANFKVDVYMPNSDSETENVLVIGKQTNVDRAIAYIGKVIERDTEQREKKYEDEYY